MNRIVVERRSVVRKSRTDEPFRFALGLDLGQARDYSAVVIVERLTEMTVNLAIDCKLPIPRAIRGALPAWHTLSPDRRRGRSVTCREISCG